MTQGQRLLAGVHAATRRYYASPRRGAARRQARDIAECGRTLSHVAERYIQAMRAVASSLGVIAPKLFRAQLMGLLEARLHASQS